MKSFSRHLRIQFLIVALGCAIGATLAGEKAQAYYFPFVKTKEQKIQAALVKSSADSSFMRLSALCGDDGRIAFSKVTKNEIDSLIDHAISASRKNHPFVAKINQDEMFEYFQKLIIVAWVTDPYIKCEILRQNRPDGRESMCDASGHEHSCVYWDQEFDLTHPYDPSNKIPTCSGLSRLEWNAFEKELSRAPLLSQ